MYSYRTSSRLAVALFITACLLSLPAFAQTSPELLALSQQEGRWSVVDTFKAGPDEVAELSKGLVAERRMVGSFLEETLHASETLKPLRIDYLGYDATAGQWRYVSIEARIPVAPMSASSFERDTPQCITVRFDPFAAPPVAPGWAGRVLRMEEVITRDGPDHETKDQYFILADGSARRWLAHRYDYRRLR